MTEFFQRVPTVGGICHHLKARIIDTIMFRDGITVEVVFKHVKLLNFSVHYLHYVSYFKTHFLVMMIFNVGLIILFIMLL